MGAGDLELLDILITDDDDDVPRLKVGDQFSGKGVGQDCAFLSPDGFIGLPNAPDGTGACAQALTLTMGNDRFVIASMDGRYAAKTGNLSPGDRAIVSNCDASLQLSQADNKIQLLAESQSMEVTLDASAQTVTAKVGSNEITVGTSSASMSVSGGGSVSCDATSITLTLGLLQLTMIGTTLNIATTSGPPAILQVNGVPVAVP
jgi:hypothetical protein